ncbi:zf-HC2 domain-containing protein [Streptomyces sp. MS06]|uniref:zf-HC2 domain-containing protein n=1 Tax=Streptomyces sp. MS06 TaxID=3385974 RepID=UPI0039A145E9
MSPLERHHDAAAYALGVLDPADAFRFEDHLPDCPRCTAQVTGFGPTARQLLLYRSATPRPVHPMARPGDILLDRLLGRITARRRAARRRFRFAVAASVLLSLGGSAVAVVAAGGHGVAPLAATDARSGVWAQIVARDEAWGSRVELRIRDGSGHRSCRLVAVGRDGSEQTVTSWAVPGRAEGPSTLQGGAALHPDQIDHYEVRTADGRRLVTVDTRTR